MSKVVHDAITQGLEEARLVAQLSDEQLAALQAFAAAHGPKWKSVLTDTYWYNARIWRGPEDGYGYLLHGIRNQFGPAWLQKFKLPKV